MKEQMEMVADNIVVAEIFKGCGHSLSLEQPEKLARCLKRLILSEEILLR